MADKFKRVECDSTGKIQDKIGQVVIKVTLIDSSESEGMLKDYDNIEKSISIGCAKVSDVFKAIEEALF